MKIKSITDKYDDHLMQIGYPKYLSETTVIEKDGNKSNSQTSNAMVKIENADRTVAAEREKQQLHFHLQVLKQSRNSIVNQYQLGPVSQIRNHRTLWPTIKRKIILSFQPSRPKRKKH